MSSSAHQIGGDAVPVPVTRDSEQSVRHQIQAVVEVQVPSDGIQEIDGDAGTTGDIVRASLQSLLS